MRLTQHITCKTKHYLGNCAAPYVQAIKRKRSGCNHGFHPDTETSTLLIARRYPFYGSLRTLCDCGVTIPMLCNYHHECNTHLQRGQGKDNSMHYAVKQRRGFGTKWYLK